MIPDTVLQVSDLKERQVLLYVALEEIEGPPLPWMVSSTKWLAGLVEKAEPILEMIVPRNQPQHPAQLLTNENTILENPDQ
jgi:hypothetical protein